MLPPNIKPDWSSDDALALRAFLQSDTGQRALHHLAESAPALLDGSDVNKTLVASGCVKGFSDAINALISLTVETPESITPVKSAFPDLDDESSWNPDNTPR